MAPVMLNMQRKCAPISYVMVDDKSYTAQSSNYIVMSTRDLCMHSCYTSDVYIVYVYNTLCDISACLVM